MPGAQGTQREVVGFEAGHITEGLMDEPEEAGCLTSVGSEQASSICNEEMK